MSDSYSKNDLISQPEEIPHVFTVGELTAAVRGVLELNFDTLWLEGEISGYKVAQSQHAYFNLKDDKAQVRCVMFRGHRAGMKFTPADGDQVLLHGRMSLYEARGEYQIIVESMEPRGLGALQKAFEQLKEKLEKEGLFDPAKKKSLPEMPWKIGVVTSPTGAAIRDILNVLGRRHPKLSVLLYPVRVQGEGAAGEIAEAIRHLNTRDDLDLLLVGRGGGSIEDLWAFNEEVVARAIYGSKLPVVSAVGHEVDFTIADFVADLRAPTPSAAAEIIVPVLEETQADLRRLAHRLMEAMLGQVGSRRDQLRSYIERRFFREPERILEAPAQRLDELTGRLQRGLLQILEARRERFSQTGRRLIFASPQKLLRQKTERMGELNLRLLRGLNQGVEVKRERLGQTLRRLIAASPEKLLHQQKGQVRQFEHLLVRVLLGRMQLERQKLQGLLKNLAALSPLNVLARGYSLTTDFEEGKVVQDSRQVKPGDLLRVRLAKGELDVTVEDTFD